MTRRLTSRALTAATAALLATLALSSCTPQPVPVAAPASAPVASGALNAEEARFVELLNAERTRAGLAPVTVSAGAVSIARGWAAEISRRGTLVHNPDLASQVSASVSGAWARIGENVGTGSDADQIHGLLMSSSSHRANMLEPAFDIVGVGVARNGATLWVSLVFVAL
jgi:uncharacterized protein YkwD